MVSGFGWVLSKANTSKILTGNSHTCSDSNLTNIYSRSTSDFFFILATSLDLSHHWTWFWTVHALKLTSKTPGKLEKLYVRCYQAFIEKRNRDHKIHVETRYIRTKLTSSLKLGVQISWRPRRHFFDKKTMLSSTVWQALPTEKENSATTGAKPHQCFPP